MINLRIISIVGVGFAFADEDRKKLESYFSNLPNRKLYTDYDTYFGDFYNSNVGEYHDAYFNEYTASYASGTCESYTFSCSGKATYDGYGYEYDYDYDYYDSYDSDDSSDYYSEDYGDELDLDGLFGVGFDLDGWIDLFGERYVGLYLNELDFGPYNDIDWTKVNLRTLDWENLTERDLKRIQDDQNDTITLGAGGIVGIILALLCCCGIVAGVVWF